ncbi:RecQ family ATP-dependent DNA helicase [Capnocytophaga canimorsus]|uniref:RecQ family ATP-dependent DNA helicase n=1 Tax=Capnocytophaga canimorsus TaxID=28188 RepID=UPI0005897713|nr:ATP-dependent DNA helicase RecQ [Capnocytophaga canimorsus]CEN44777.1 ATP-dependent DNA helicase recQ [Capnocytophaga canimorsus]
MTETPLEILKKYWGYDAFRSPQADIVQAVLEGKNVLALMPTGGGKSIAFQVPALLKSGICIVVSPLIALINDQVEGLKKRGIRALSLAGALSYTDLERILNNAVLGNYKFLYLSPERLQQEIVRDFIKSMPVNLIVIDEAHCISHWGKDFRPAYLECVWLKEQFPKIPILALTASATQRVQNDIVQLMQMNDVQVIKSSLKRPNIAYMVYKTEDKWRYLEQILHKNTGSSIVYVRSRKSTVEMAEYLNTKGLTATYFHGGLTNEQKSLKMQMWMLGDVQVMVATNAFGMGIDKPDVRTVIHWGIPPTLEDYFQEAGRAGRDGEKAFAVMLYNDYQYQSTQKKFLLHQTDVPFLKLLYAKLNAYFQIAYGEGEEIVHHFQFSDFCMRYKLNPQQVANGLALLEAQSVLTFNQSYFSKATVHFLVSGNQVIDYLKNNPKYKDLVFFFLRNYPGIHDQPMVVNLEKVAVKMNLSADKIENDLIQLQKEEIIAYRGENNDAEITFHFPRRDDALIYSIAKNVKAYNQMKETLFKQMLRFLDDDKKCKSQQLLAYFGEENTQPCGICSVCVANKQAKTNINLVKSDILALLQQKAMSSQDLIFALEYQQTIVLEALKILLSMNEIRLNEFNEYLLDERKS